MRALAALLLWAFAQNLLADSSIYDVEVLVFYQPTGSSEQAPALVGSPDLSKAGPLERKGVTLTSGDQLVGVRKRLEQTGYQILRHLSWRQSLENGTVPQPFKVTYPEQGDTSSARRLMGTIGLGRSNYAILKVDLLLQDGGRSYRLEETRRMKRNELHYLDHPKLGVIATIQPTS